MAGVVPLLALLVWSAGGGPARPAPDRPIGAGLPPIAVARATPPPVRHDDDPDTTARRAEIAAEEARLAALLTARLRLEQDLSALERDLAAQRQARAPAARWAGPAVTVVLHHRSNAAAAAAALAEALRATAGLEVEPPRETPFAPSTPVVRYFYAADEEVARDLATRLGGGWAVQDFRAYQPRPAPRTIELWLTAE